MGESISCKLSLSEESNFDDLSNHHDNLKEKSLAYMLKYNKVPIDNWNISPTLENSKIFALRFSINHLTGIEIFKLKNDKVFLYLYSNSIIDDDLLLTYTQNSIKGTFFSNIIDDNWIVDFYYLFIYGGLDGIDYFREVSDKNKQKYDTTRDINILKTINDISMVVDFVDKTGNLPSEWNESFKLFIDSIDMKESFIRKIAERYPLLLFSMLKYTSKSSIYKFNILVDLLYQSLWYTCSYQIIKMSVLH